MEITDLNIDQTNLSEIMQDKDRIFFVAVDGETRKVLSAVNFKKDYFINKRDDVIFKAAERLAQETMKDF